MPANISKILLPQNLYNEDIDWIREVMEENKLTIPSDSMLFCGLFLSALKNENDLSRAMMAAFEGGADGIAFFDLNALTEIQKEEIKKLSQTMIIR